MWRSRIENDARGGFASAQAATGLLPHIRFASDACTMHVIVTQHMRKLVRNQSHSIVRKICVLGAKMFRNARPVFSAQMHVNGPFPSVSNAELCICNGGRVQLCKIFLKRFENDARGSFGLHSAANTEACAFVCSFRVAKILFVRRGKSIQHIRHRLSHFCFHGLHCHLIPNISPCGPYALLTPPFQEPA